MPSTNLVSFFIHQSRDEVQDNTFFESCKSSSFCGDYRFCQGLSSLLEKATQHCKVLDTAQARGLLYISQEYSDDACISSWADRIFFLRLHRDQNK
jgi:hypothetical protein